ncbi:quinone-dependent dihydroorotate dehydrogenase [Pseudoroseicyclus tamaricis]|uniref:Dihydroorotate dehydrogenase (quinone) n=1 Tax=Pseudoroseicyclus tamaricis TaxID=2705421 RepID=A0A6B2JLC9_9RHOB|nr:quinone-dependent dihydroorotate dehydrogenase [Pseudoroseicyclus tamaricis]NDV02353.1 quinone-dependent dihydroorotate dehydrogenase [Pseudoroseicyclus tamaricis]
MDGYGLALSHRMEPERAHNLALRALRLGLGPRTGPVTSSRLTTSVGGLLLPNPLGLAAGFDKNGEALDALARMPFGFAEIGAITPRPQPGNPRPRLFRLTEDRAAINRFGFNNRGMDDVAARLAWRPPGVLGLNIGANKDSEDRAADFAAVLSRCGDLVDFVTINISSPNTERLRDLQGKDALAALLEQVMTARAELSTIVPVFLKIAPDLSEAELEDIATLAEQTRLSGLIATNTTLSREGLTSPLAREAGGLSGAPLFEKSTRVLAQLSGMTSLPLIGVGGVASAQDAYDKIQAGASAVQMYTGLVFGGLNLPGEILEELDALLARDGFANVREAVGTDRERWLA